MNRLTNRRVQIATALFCFVIGWLGSAAAARDVTPQVEFDTSYTVECRDVTPCEFASRYPDSKIVEARFRISTWFTAGREADLSELLVEITSPDQVLPIVDFMPRTELDTNIAGEIEVVQTDETTKTSNAGLGGSVGVEYGIIKGQVAPSAGGGKSQLASVKETYKRIPPKQLLLASGTINRGYGVFFKLKPSPQEALEGVREFACLFLVPAAWRGESLEVSCVARTLKKSYFSTSEETCGEKTFHVGLYLEGDVVARTVAEELARAEGRRPAGERPRSGSEVSWTSLKPLMSQAVNNSRNLFTTSPIGKHEPTDSSRMRAASPKQSRHGERWNQ